MHAIEKILAKNSGRKDVRTGEIVTAKVDFAEINDLYHQCLQPGFYTATAATGLRRMHLI